MGMRLEMGYFAVGRIESLRLCCQLVGCGAVTELRLQKVEDALKRSNASCPVCGRPFTKQGVEGGADILTQLAKALMAIDSLAEQVRIEVPLTNPDKEHARAQSLLTGGPGLLQ
jgi:hypothetical protein